MTHRGVAAQLTVFAGYDPDALDYVSLARASGTLVVFMGLAELDTIAERLIAAGKEPATPTAVIASGTLDDEETVVSTLDSVAADAALVEPPALVVIGDVVSLAERLAPAAYELQGVLSPVRSRR